jgi:hypothetical protein
VQGEEGGGERRGQGIVSAVELHPAVITPDQVRVVDGSREGRVSNCVWWERGTFCLLGCVP